MLQKEVFFTIILEMGKWACIGVSKCLKLSAMNLLLFIFSLSSILSPSIHTPPTPSFWKPLPGTHHTIFPSNNNSRYQRTREIRGHFSNDDLYILRIIHSNSLKFLYSCLPDVVSYVKHPTSIDQVCSFDTLLSQHTYSRYKPHPNRISKKSSPFRDFAVLLMCWYPPPQFRTYECSLT